MSYKDLYTMTSPSVTLPAAAYSAATTDGTTVDRKFNESAIVVISIGAWTDGTHTFTLEESDDDVTYTEVAASQIQGTLPTISDATTDDSAVHVGYLGSARYIRLSTAADTATTGAIFSAVVVQDYPRYSGASQLTP